MMNNNTPEPPCPHFGRRRAVSLLSTLLLSGTCFASVIPEPQRSLAIHPTPSLHPPLMASPHKSPDGLSYTVASRPVNATDTNTRPDPHQLLEASLRGDLRMVQELVRQKVNIQFANEDGERALHMAAARGHLPIVIFLISHGANMNARTVKNWIPLHHAIRFNHPVVANYLLAKGAPPYFRTTDGVNAMGIAEAVRNQRMINLVMNYM